MNFPNIFDASALNGVNGFKLTASGAGFAEYMGEGTGLAGIGDVNGDSRSDFVIGAWNSGVVYVIFGQLTFPSVLNVTYTLNGINGFTIVASSQEIGSALAGAGDVNGDGKQDLIIGGINSNKVYIIFGAPSYPAVFNVSILNGTNGFTLTSSSGEFGISVSSAGDINSDGKSDLVIGTDLSDGSTGAYVVFGSGNFSTMLNVSSSLNGTNGFSITGGGFTLGRSVSGAGDVNGDGSYDIIVGQDEPGAAYIIFGTNSFPAIFNVSTLNGTNGFRITSSDGWIYPPVASAGDINSDGFGDLIIGSNSEIGYAYIIFGKNNFPATFDTSAINGTNGFKMVASGGIEFAISVADIGDINSDGKTDIAAGGYGINATWIVYGSKAFPALLNMTSDLNGTNGFRVDISNSTGGSMVAGAGDVNSDGGLDLIVGFNNAAYVIYGLAPTPSHTSTTSHSHTSILSRTPTATTPSSTKTPSSELDKPTISSRPGTLLNHTLSNANIPTPSHTPTSTPTHTSSAQFSESSTRSTSNSFTSSQSSASHTQSPSGTHSPEITQTPSTLSRTQSKSITSSSTGTQSSELTTTRFNTRSTSLTPSNSAFNTATRSIADTVSKTTTQSAVPTHTPSPSPPTRAFVNLQDTTDKSILRIPGPNEADAIGYFVSGIGDINHDGRGDFLISTSKTNTSANLDSTSCIGEAYVVFGQESIPAFPTDVLSINSTTGFVIPNIKGFTIAKTATGWQTWCQSMGTAAGDVNGDGVADFMISNFRTTTSYPQGNTGVAYTIFGKTSGFGSSFDLSSIDGWNGFKISAGYVSNAETDGYANVLPGKRLASKAVTFSERALGSSISGGDINGDGYADIMIGDPWNSRLTGEVTGVYGQRSSFAPAYYVDSLGASGFNIPGPAPLSNVGQAVSTADINGDGKADIVFNNQNGFAYVVFGASNFSSTYNLAALNGTNGFAIVGAPSGNKMVLTTGDINGDGKSDIIASTPDQAQGIVYVVFGSSSFAPQFNVSSLNGNNGFSIKGTATGRTLGVSIATGDVNGDHIADLIIAESDSACVSGSAYVIYGKADFSKDAAFNLSALDGTNGYKIINIPGCDSQGFTVSSADVDGNGRDDVLIGSGAQVSGGDVFVFFS